MCLTSINKKDILNTKKNHIKFQRSIIAIKEL